MIGLHSLIYRICHMLALFVSLCWCTITVCPFVCVGQIYFPLCLKRYAGNKPNTSGVSGLTQTQKQQVKWQLGWSNTEAAHFEKWSSALSEFWYLTQRWKPVNKWCCCFGEPAVFRSTDCTNDWALSVKASEAHNSQRGTSWLYCHFLSFWHSHSYTRNQGAWDRMNF